MSQNNDDKPHSYTESAYKEFDPHLPCVPAKKEPSLERLAGKLKPNYNHAQRIKPVESSEPQEKEQYEEITSASNVIRFLSEYIHGINNGRRKESIDLLLLNAADHFKRLPVSAPSESQHLDKLVALREFIESKINRFVYWDEENKKWFESDQKAASESQEEMWSDVISEARFYDGSPHDLKSMIKYMEKRFTITRKPQ